jgi:peptidoglycan/LPS O-acetylase OafA/YrhL
MFEVRVRALDGLRGIAIILVVSVHAGWVPGGGHGVTLFFVLSGFLITRLLVREMDDGAFSVGRF